MAIHGLPEKLRIRARGDANDEKAQLLHAFNKERRHAKSYFGF
jgi:hypothetical protein